MSEEALIYTLTVPGNPDSQTVFEGLCETFLREGDGITPEVALTLRLSVAEACRNALNQDSNAGHMNVCTLTFLQKEGTSNASGLVLEIEDPGKGLVVKGARPPYPPELLKKEVILFRPLRQEIVAKVVDPYSVTISSPNPNEQTREMPDRDEVLASLDSKGMGLLALCRCWASISFEFVDRKGTILRMENPYLMF